MRGLWKQELKKIVKRKTTIIGFLFLAILMISLPFFSTSKEDVAQQKKDAQEFVGTMDEAYIEHVTNQMHKDLNGISKLGMEEIYQKAYVGKYKKYDYLYSTIGQVYSKDLNYGYVSIFDTIDGQVAKSYYSDWRKMASQKQASYHNGTEKEVHGYLLEHQKEFQYGYAQGWHYASNTMLEVMLSITLVVVVLLAGVFATERSSGTNSLILSSKMGRKQMIKSKIVAALCFVTLLYVVAMLLFYGTTFFIYGIEGANVSIQVGGKLATASSIMQMNQFQLTTTLIIFGYISTIFVTMITLTISEFAKSSFKTTITLIISVYCIYVACEMSESGILSQVLMIFPFSLTSIKIFQDYHFILFENTYLYVPLIALLIDIMLCNALYQMIKLHYVRSEA